MYKNSILGGKNMKINSIIINRTFIPYLISRLRRETETPVENVEQTQAAENVTLSEQHQFHTKNYWNLSHRNWKKKWVKLEIISFTDYVQPNAAPWQMDNLTQTFFNTYHTWKVITQATEQN